MTDPRLEAAVAAAYDDKSLVNLSSVTFTEARRFLAMLRAALPWLHDALRAFDQAQAKAKCTLCEMPEYCPKFGCIKSAYQSQPESEVMPHSERRARSEQYNAMAPVMGADPLDAAASQARMLWGGTIQFDELEEDEQDKWRDIVRVGIAFANAQLPSQGEIDAAKEVFGAYGTFISSEVIKLVLIAAYKARTLEVSAGSMAPPVMGADPPWLDEAASASFHASIAGQFYSFPPQSFSLWDEQSKERWRSVVRAVLAFAHAQPPSEAEIEEATREYYDAMNGFAGYHQLTEPAKLFWREKAKRILIAAAKARSGA